MMNVSALGRDPNLPPAAKTKVAIRDLDFFYGKSQSLKRVSLEFPERQITAIIGPSGCGKSTLLRVLNRVYSMYPTQRASGKVTIDGEDILAPTYPLNRLRTQVGMVFQQPTPFAMSIFDNIALAVKHHEEIHPRDLNYRVENALTRAALWDEVKDKLHNSALGLSGGQQQRLCIARAIAVEPEILLMDEPTSALDPQSTLRIEELMTQLKQRYTIIVVTHNLAQAARIADYTAFMLKGELIEFGPTLKLFTEHSRKETEDYITGRFG